jgi:hypothetical protein
MHSYFIELVRAADREHARQYRATSATISGSGLNWHDMEGYFNAGMASYSFDENNKVAFNKFEKPFDVVIMNDCSQCPIHPDLSGLFREYAKKHSDTVRKHGAIPVLFMTCLRGCSEEEAGSGDVPEGQASPEPDRHLSRRRDDLQRSLR